MKLRVTEKNLTRGLRGALAGPYEKNREVLNMIRLKSDKGVLSTADTTHTRLLAHVTALLLNSHAAALQEDIGGVHVWSLEWNATINSTKS